jgi:hypothetical protein
LWCFNKLWLFKKNQRCWRISICNYKSLLRRFSQTFSQTHYVFEYYNGARNYGVQKESSDV